MPPRPVPFSLPMTLLGLVFAGLGARLVYLQGVHGDDLARRAERMCRGIERTGAPRGRILDRAGRVLAVSVATSSLVADPREVRIGSVRDPARVATLLAPALGRSEADVFAKLEGDGRFRYVARELTQERREALEALLAGAHVVGLRFEEDTARVYPQGAVLAHVVGHVGGEGRGESGVEKSFDARLRGDAGERSFARLLLPTTRGARGIALPDDRSPEPARDLVLSVDAAISAYAAEELDRIAAEFRPEWAVAIVLDPRDGAVLALEGLPRFDPNRVDALVAPYRELMNRAIAWPYSPGSAFKPFVYAGALEAGILDPSMSVECGASGEWRFGARTVKDHEPMGTLTARDVLAHSSNIGMAKIGLALGIPRTEAWVRRFGFGEKTGIELPWEQPGVVHPVAKWTENYSLVSVSFGYELTATPLRLAASFCALANGGVPVRPTVQAPLEEPAPGTTPARLVSARTHALVLDAMEEVVRTGTGKRLRSDRVRIAGKTGTTVKHGEGPRRYTSTFVGFAPADDPRALVLLVADEPKGGKYYAGDVVVPAAGRLLERTLAYLQILPPLPPGPASGGGDTAVRVLPWRHASVEEGTR